MTPKECKRLAEMDFPIAVVAKHAARENSLCQGAPASAAFLPGAAAADFMFQLNKKEFSFFESTNCDLKNKRREG
jgi:hypothetical protein